MSVIRLYLDKLKSLFQRYSIQDSKSFPTTILCFYIQLVFASNVKAQNYNVDYSGYYSLFNKYLICIADSNELDAYKHLRYALNNYAGFPGHYNLLIHYELKIGNRTKALQYAKKATSLGYQYFDEEINTTDIVEDKQFDDSIFVKLLAKKYPRWRRSFIGDRPPYYELLTNEILVMSNIDQYIRYYIHTRDSSTWHYSNEVDSVNYVYFRSIVNKYGFPQIRKLDNKASRALVLLLCHFRTLDLVTGIDSNEMNWLDSVMKSAVIQGNLRPTDYAFFIDRYYNYKTRGKDEIQLYGEFNWEDRFTRITNIEEVDKRRSEIFLIPLKYKAKLDQLALPEGYKY